MKLTISNCRAYSGTKEVARLEKVKGKRSRWAVAVRNIKHGRLLATLDVHFGCFNPYRHGRRTHKTLEAAVASCLRHAQEKMS